MRNQDFPVKLSASERSESDGIVRTGQQKAWSTPGFLAHPHFV